MASWAAVLDDFEQRIAGQRAALDRDEPPTVEEFAPPSGLAPLPAALLPRAETLLRESVDLVAELAGSVAHLKQDLAVVRTVGASTGRAAGARFVDTSA
jgi:hypothetical protein